MWLGGGHLGRGTGAAQTGSGHHGRGGRSSAIVLVGAVRAVTASTAQLLGLDREGQLAERQLAQVGDVRDQVPRLLIDRGGQKFCEPGLGGLLLVAHVEEVGLERTFLGVELGHPLREQLLLGAVAPTRLDRLEIRDLAAVDLDGSFDLLDPGRLRRGLLLGHGRRHEEDDEHHVLLVGQFDLTDVPAVEQGGVRLPAGVHRLVLTADVLHARHDLILRATDALAPGEDLLVAGDRVHAPLGLQALRDDAGRLVGWVRAPLLRLGQGHLAGNHRTALLLAHLSCPCPFG